MNYRQRLALALAELGQGREREALEGLAEARRAAAAVDPGGPREAEVLLTLAQLHEQAGRPAPARQALAEAAAIWERQPAELLGGGLGPLYERLAELSRQLGEEAEARRWAERPRGPFPGA